MVRVEGPGVLALNALFRWDWEMETGRDLDVQAENEDPYNVLQPGEKNVQVIPSGPGMTGSGIYQLLLLSIYSARQEIVMTRILRGGFWPCKIRIFKTQHLWI